MYTDDNEVFLAECVNIEIEPSHENPPLTIKPQVTCVSTDKSVPQTEIIDRLCLIETSVCDLLMDIKVALNKTSTQEDSQHKCLNNTDTLDEIRSTINQLSESMNNKFKELGDKTDHMTKESPEKRLQTQLLEITSKLSKQVEDLDRKTDHLQKHLAEVDVHKTLVEQGTQTMSHRTKTEIGIQTDSDSHHAPPIKPAPLHRSQPPATGSTDNDKPATASILCEVPIPNKGHNSTDKHATRLWAGVAIGQFSGTQASH